MQLTLQEFIVQDKTVVCARVRETEEVIPENHAKQIIRVVKLTHYVAITALS